jgi:hypothetical protein
MKAARVLRFDSPNVITNVDLTQPAPVVGRLLVRDFPPQINNRESGVYDGTDAQSRLQIEQVIRDHKDARAKEICNAALEYAVKQDDYLEQIHEADRIDDKTVFIIKRT